MANIGAIVGGGFALIRRRPGAVLTWGAVYTLGSAALAYVQLRLTGETGPAMAGRWDGSMVLHGLGTQILFGLLGLALSVILSAAAFRAVLWPQDRGLASMRFGMDEARLFGLTLILYVLGLVGGLLGGLGFAFVTTLIGLLFGGSPGMAAVFAFVATMGVFGLILFLLVRLSVVYPLVLVRRRISLDEGWELTRGHFWSLLGAYVLIGLAMTVLIGIVLLPLFALHAGQSFQTGANYWFFLFGQMRGGAAPAALAMLAGGVLAGSLLFGVLLALTAGSAASAAKELLAGRDAALSHGEGAEPVATDPEWRDD